MPLLQTFGSASIRGYERFGPIGPAATDFQLISTTYLASATTSVTFGSIPQTFKHLQIRTTTRTTQAGTGMSYQYVTFNGDGSSSYSWHSLYGETTSKGSYSGASQSYGWFGPTPMNSEVTGLFGGAIADVLDYTNTFKYKTGRSLAGEVGTTPAIHLDSWNWRSTSAITSITITDASPGGFANGSRFSLYGWN